MQDSGINVFFQGINSLLLLKGLWTTLHISLLSAGLSIPLGILLGIFMTLKNPIARVVSRIYLEIVRIMPQLVLLFVVYFGFTRAFGWNLSAYWSAIIVFTFWGTGEMGDLVRGALISIPKTQYESAQVLGLSKLQTMRLVVLPQAVRQLIPPSINLITRMNLLQVCAARNGKLHIILGTLRSVEHVHRRKVDALAAYFGNMRGRMPAAAAKIARPIGLYKTASWNMGLKRSKEREIHGRFAAVNLDADAAGQITRKLLINTNQRIGRNFGREKYFWGFRRGPYGAGRRESHPDRQPKFNRAPA